MKNTIWHSGPPPEIGWWPASKGRDETVLRWWNGKVWSRFAGCNDTPKLAAFYAAQKEIDWTEIEWTERWWLK